LRLPLSFSDNPHTAWCYSGCITRRDGGGRYTTPTPLFHVEIGGGGVPIRRDRHGDYGLGERRYAPSRPNGSVFSRLGTMEMTGEAGRTDRTDCPDGNEALDQRDDSDRRVDSDGRADSDEWDESAGKRRTRHDGRTCKEVEPGWESMLNGEPCRRVPDHRIDVLLLDHSFSSSVSER
jgi:hypothetical protein